MGAITAIAGLANAGSVMFLQKCVLRRETLPILPCDCADCEWYIYDSSFNNCFWALAHVFNTEPGTKFSFEEIALLEGVTLNEVIIAYETAINKLRKESRTAVKSNNFDNIS